jgi:RNA polymerase sigma-70 factor (ECF subfamily)
MPEPDHPTSRIAKAPRDRKPTAELAARAKGGDRLAFTRLADSYHERIFRMVCFRTRSRSDAEDISQEVFLQAFRSIHRLKDPDRFEGWLYRIAMNRITDFYRKRKFRSLFSPLLDADGEGGWDEAAPEDRGTEAQVLKSEFWKQVRTLLEQLPRMEKEVFMLRFFDDLGIREISETLGKSESTVKTHLYRGLEKFKNAASLREFLERNVP